MSILFLLLFIFTIACEPLTLFSQSSSLAYHVNSSSSSVVSWNVHENHSKKGEYIYRSLLNNLSAHQLASFFSENKWTDDQILGNPALYARTAFLTVAKHIPSYPEYVAYYHTQHQSLSSLKKFWGRLTGSYVPCRAKHFVRLYSGCQTTLRLRHARTRTVQAGKNTLALMIHPIESVKAIAHGLGSLVMLAGRTVMPLAELHCLREAGRDEQADEAYIRLKQNSKVVLKYCKKELKKIGLRDVVKQGTALVADIVISGKLLQAASAICRHAKFLSNKMLSQLKQEEAVAAYAHGSVEKLLMESAENVPVRQPPLPAASAVAETAHASSAGLQEFHASLMKSLEPEIVRLRTLFDNRYKGFAECAK